MTDNTNDGERATRSRSGSRTKRARETKEQRAARERAKREQREASESAHVPESDRTVEGGVYRRNDGTFVDAHGNALSEGGERLDDDERAEYEQERLAKLDELADQD